MQTPQCQSEQLHIRRPSQAAVSELYPPLETASKARNQRCRSLQLPFHKPMPVTQNVMRLTTNNADDDTLSQSVKPISPQLYTRVVDSGHYALFDVWWNDDEGELTNTVCPPSVVHIPATTGLGGQPARDDRSPSSIDITAEPPTIIHIPSSAQINLSDATTYPDPDSAGDFLTYGKVFDKVKEADDLENRDTDGDETPDGVGDGIVWTLPACPPDGGAADGDLCLSFSAALLEDADWVGDIEFHVDHVHQVDIEKQDPRYVLVHDVPADDASEAGDPLWNSSNARKSTVSVAPGDYKRPLWFFTSRGTYEFQVHIQGDPDQTKASGRDDGLDPVSTEPSVTSDQRQYIIHVGAEANLGVEVDVPTATPSPQEEVTITITASNDARSDEAQETKVDVTLPDGLTYSSHAPATDTFADSDSDGIWTWDADNLETNTSKTLTITATVDANTHGQELTVDATISATEPVNITETVEGEKSVVTYHVPVPDPTPGNNTATGTITVANKPNVNPMFQVTRSVPENSSAGTNVGDTIAVREPDSGDTLTFSLTGEGAGNFTVSSVTGGAQITVGTGADLDYEITQSYDLTLGVSDGKDAAGDPDSSIDHTIAVRVDIIDDPWDSGTLSVRAENPATLSASVTFTAEVTGLPSGHGSITYSWRTRSKLSGGTFSTWVTVPLHSGHTYEVTSSDEARVFQVEVTARVNDDQGVTRTIGPTIAEVEWAN